MTHAFLFGPWPVVLSAVTLLALLGGQWYLITTSGFLAEIAELAALPGRPDTAEEDRDELDRLARDVRRHRLLVICVAVALSLVTAQLMVLRVFLP